LAPSTARSLSLAVQQRPKPATAAAVKRAEKPEETGAAAEESAGTGKYENIIGFLKPKSTMGQLPLSPEQNLTKEPLTSRAKGVFSS